MNKTAQGLAALGRGPDTELVHMTKGEVAGLQSLAERHGGSLTINPATGLPEASFLESILPAVINASNIPMADTPRYGDMGQNFGREQNYFPRAGGAASGIESVYNPQTGKFVEGEGPASKYTYDPRTQTYGGGETQAAKLVQGQFGPTTDGGSYDPGMLPRTRDYLDWEANTPEGREARDARMQEVSNALTLGIPGAGLASKLAGRGVSFPNFGVLFGTPDAYTRYQADFAKSMDPMSGPGTIGSRDTRGSNEASLADIEANAAAMQSMQNELMADQAAASGLGGFGGFGGYTTPDTTNYGGVSGGFQGGFGSGSVGSPSESSASTSFGSGDGMFSGAQSGDVGFAVGGITSLASGPVEAMSNANTIGANTGYPQSAITPRAYATPFQQPMPQNVVSGAQDVGVNPYTGQAQFAVGGLTALAGGGATRDSLGDYSDGGRLLRGPGDGTSDDIPATIGKKQPARVADGEFVVSADVVSGLGNGSTEAGARKLYAMMDRVRKARTGTEKMGKTINADKYLAA